MPRLGTLMGSLVVMVAAACSDFSPERVESEFVLAAVDGEPLPATVVDQPHRFSRAIADTIRLHPDGTGLRISVEEYTNVQGDQAPELLRSAVPFTYHIDGLHFGADYDCPDNASCIAGPHLRGLTTGGTLVIQFDIQWTGKLAYERIE